MAKTIRWKTTAIALLFILLLVPSAWFAWQNRHMPQFGQAHDDAIYYIASKSLADGQGYRILSLPQTPYETKYPPLLPWLLSIAWFIQPKFPENLAIAVAIQWALIPPFLWLCAVWFRRMGFSESYRWLAVALLAIQPYTVMFAAGIFTETLYAGFLLGSLIALDKARLQVEGSRWGLYWSAFAGALAGIGYLARSAGVVAIVSGPLVFLVWKKRREAMAFFLGMIPMVVGWMVWARIHQSSSTDFISLYNTNYLGFQLANVHWNNLGAVAWTNLAHMLYEMGALLFPLEDTSFFMQLLRDTIAIAIIWRLFCRRRDPALQPYLWFAALSVVELLVWHFPPNLRLMYPLVPLFAAGLIWEGQQLVQMIRQCLTHRDRSQRVAAWIIGGVASAAGLLGLWTQVYMTFRVLPELTRTNESILEERAAAYRWIGQHVDSNLNVMAINPALYLYTGRHTASTGIMPIDWYRHDQARMLAPFRGISAFASENRLDYIYMHDSDYGALIPDAADAARTAVESHAGLRRVFHSGPSSIFQVEGVFSSAAR
jgi:4-amino-4-deoxy-L-arabinose transferase-like glycosyltransferase